MKSFYVIVTLLVSFNLTALAQDASNENTTMEAPQGATKVDPPVGTIVPPTKAQLKSVKKPKHRKKKNSKSKTTH